MDIEKLYKTLTGEPYPYLADVALAEPRSGGLLRAGGSDKDTRGGARRDAASLSRPSGHEAR